MIELYLIKENLIKGYQPSILDISYLLSILSGVFVIITRNPIVSVLFLIGLFISISGYLICVGANFIGLSYLLVYVGAVSILFLFTLMLINIRIAELHVNNTNSVPLGFLFGMALYYPLLKIVPSEYNTQNPLIGFSNLFASIFLRKNFDVNHINNIGIDLSTSIKWDGNIISHSQISSMGNIMYTSHSIWLIVVSVILLLAMVGSIIVTLDTKKNTTLKGAVISNS